MLRRRSQPYRFEQILELARYYRDQCLKTTNAATHHCVAERALRTAHDWEKFMVQVNRSAEIVASSERLIAEADGVLGKK